MNITDKLVAEFRSLAKEYDEASDMATRIELGKTIEDFGAKLSDRQILPFLKRCYSK